jgi:hypothetical protein
LNKPFHQLELGVAEVVEAPESAPDVAPTRQSDSHDFNWDADSDSVIIPHQPAIAVYFNDRHEVVIRQEGHYHPDEDHWIYLRIENLDPLIDQLQRIARREIEPESAS